MNRGDKGRIHERYSDILREGDDETVARVVRDLDIAYQLGNLPFDNRAPQRADLRSRRFRAPAGRRAWRQRVNLAGAFVLAVFAVIGVAVAATNILNLGKPTNDLPSNFLPIGGFHYTPITVQERGEPVVLLMGTAVDFRTAVVRWPLVKALTQFGAFVGAKPGPQVCHYPLSITPVPSGHYRIQPPIEPCGPPTFDLARASYHSTYIAFREVDLLDQQQRVRVSALSPVERRLYDTYARSHVSSNEGANIAASVLGIQNSPSSRRLPLLLIGHYVQTVEQNLTPGDFGVEYSPGSVTEGDNPVPYLSFQQTQAGLQAGRVPSKMGNVLFYGGGMLIHDVNIDANLFSALICHADGSRPRSVCSRPVIRQLLRHVK